MIDLTPERVAYKSGRIRMLVARSLAIITDALAVARQPYIAFSGGKDSVALTALVHACNPSIPLCWSDDELEYPETADYMTRLSHIAGPQLRITFGWAEHAGWFKPWTSEPYWRRPLPGTQRIDCDADDYWASQGHDLTFLGLRAEENQRRRDWLTLAGPLYRVQAGTGLRCCPLSDWTADDVWIFIAGLSLPYNAAYDRLTEIGVHRKAQRIGPLPLARRADLLQGWPTMLRRLEARYGPRWT